MVLNARDAAARGAEILTRTRVVSAERDAGALAGDAGRTRGRRAVVTARALVNAGGPWVGDVIARRASASIRPRRCGWCAAAIS